MRPRKAKVPTEAKSLGGGPSFVVPVLFVVLSFGGCECGEAVENWSSALLTAHLQSRPIKLLTSSPPEAASD